MGSLKKRDFYRFAEQRLTGLFPTLPNRTQFNRQQRLHQPALVAFGQQVAQEEIDSNDLYEALDCTGVETRNAKRRGLGWLPGQANLGYSNRVGWYEGFHLLVSTRPSGVITGFGFAPASAKDQPMAESFFRLRSDPHEGFESVGAFSGLPYLADRGFEGQAAHQRWREAYQAPVLSAPKRNSRSPWSKPLRRWLAGLRQIVETVFGKLQLTFRLQFERPHTFLGFQARLAAKMALHNFCIALNRSLGRPSLAFADLLGWL